MTVHKLDIERHFLLALLDGSKTFEVRERRDRDFKVGDVLEFTDGATYTFKVSYVLEGGSYGIEPGYVILGLESGWRGRVGSLEVVR